MYNTYGPEVVDFVGRVGNEFARQGQAGYDTYMDYIGKPFDKGARAFAAGLGDLDRKPIGPSNKYGNKELSRDVATVGTAAGKGTDAFIADFGGDQKKNRLVANPKLGKNKLTHVHRKP